MKCENNDTPPCKRCEATGKNCIFTLRANAAIGTESVLDLPALLLWPGTDFMISDR
jgi:hypothetical protein